MIDPITTERLDAGGVTLLVERRGPADGPLVFLHPGAGADHHALAPQTRFFRSMGFTTLCPDSRGLGGSDQPAGGYDVPTMAGDARAVLDAYGQRRVLLVGQSLGSAICQEVALADPGRVRGLVLMATWARTDPFLGLQMSLTQGIVRGTPPEVYARALLYLVVSRRYVGDGGAAFEGLVRGMFLGRRAPSREILLRHLAAGSSHDAAARLGSLDVPALVLSGERDLMIPAVYGEETASLLPQGRHVLMRGERSSHLFHWEMAGEVEARLAAFVKDLPD